jgi:hypothetical protein
MGIYKLLGLASGWATKNDDLNQNLTLPFSLGIVLILWAFYLLINGIYFTI